MRKSISGLRPQLGQYDARLLVQRLILWNHTISLLVTVSQAFHRRQTRLLSSSDLQWSMQIREAVRPFWYFGTVKSFSLILTGY